jgi:hypothetical protein
MTGFGQKNVGYPMGTLFYGTEAVEGGVCFS